VPDDPRDVLVIEPVVLPVLVIRDETVLADRSAELLRIDP